MPTPRLASNVRSSPIRCKLALLLASLLATSAPGVAPLAPDVAEAAGNVSPRPPTPRPYAAKPISWTRGGTELAKRDHPGLFSEALRREPSESERQKASQDFMKALAEADELDRPKKTGPDGELYDPLEDCSRANASADPACPPNWVRGFRLILDGPAGLWISDAIELGGK